jgi:hypothetical protein
MLFDAPESRIEHMLDVKLPVNSVPWLVQIA